MTSKILGIASALVKSRKFTLLLVGAQFVYIGYKYVREKRKKSKSS